MNYGAHLLSLYYDRDLKDSQVCLSEFMACSPGYAFGLNLEVTLCTLLQIYLKAEGIGYLFFRIHVVLTLIHPTEQDRN